MSRRLLAAAPALALVLSLTPPGLAGDRTAPPLPTDASRWIGAPQTWDGLRGNVTLVFVWTFG